MANSVIHDELYTVVENNCGSERVFGYLGERGVRLGIGEVYAQRGNLISKLGATTSKRKFEALRRALQADPPSLIIRSLPTPILYDPIDEVPKALAISGGVLGLVDPTYASSDSANFAAV